MDTPDIYLGPDDNEPVNRITLRAPNKSDGSPGDTFNASGATALFKCQDAEHLVAPFEAAVPFVGDVAASTVELDFLTMFPVSLPFAAGKDYEFRIKVTRPGVRKSSYPNGVDPSAGDGRTRAFFLLRVAPDFVAVP